MNPFFTLPQLRNHKRLLYISLVSFILLSLLWTGPDIRTSTQHWLASGARNTTTSSDTTTLPYTAAIIYLVQLSSEHQLLESLESVYRYLPGHPWPVILFHTGDYDEDTPPRTDFIDHLHGLIGVGNASREFSDRIEFVKLDWQLPESISSNKSVVDPVDAHRWPGYHHMCSFYSTEIFFNPRLEHVTYYMRMDTDSTFTAPSCYDPFEVMHAQQHLYGYLGTGYDWQAFTEGMYPFVQNYAKAHASVEEMLRLNNWAWSHRDENGRESEPAFNCFSTNFEIVRLEAFRRPDVKEWLDAIEAYPEGIYKWRWGDAPLRYATLAMFFDIQDVTKQLCGMRYAHRGVKEYECPCEPSQLQVEHELPDSEA